MKKNYNLALLLFFLVLFSSCSRQKESKNGAITPKPSPDAAATAVRMTPVFINMDTEENRIYARGAEHLHNNRMNKAIEAFTKVIKLNPKNADAYNNRGLAYWRQGKNKKALADANMAIKIGGDRPEYLINRANHLKALKRYDDALKTYKRLMKKKDKRVILYTLINRASLYAYTGKMEKAIGDLDRAIELNPGLSAAYMNRGLFKCRLKRYKSALTDLEKAGEIAKKPMTKIMVKYHKAACYEGLGDDKKAEMYYREFIEDAKKSGWESGNLKKMVEKAKEKGK